MLIKGFYGPSFEQLVTANKLYITSHTVKRQSVDFIFYYSSE